MESDLIVDMKREKSFNKALNDLPQEEVLSRDLWPDISRQLGARETKAYTPRWIPWAIAATLVVSFSSVFFSLHNLQNAQQLMAQGFEGDQNNQQFDIQSQINAMEQDYGLAKSALLAQIGMNSAQASSDLMMDVKSNLIIIEQATTELKAAIYQQPDNPSLPKLLKATYQQELVVLSQLAKLDLNS